MALVSEPGRDGSERPASRLLLDLPDTVWGVASVLGSLAIMLWFAFLIALARRHQKDPGAGRSLWSVVVFSLIIAAVALWHRDLPPGLLLRPPVEESMLDEEKTNRPGMNGPAISLPFFPVVGAAHRLRDPSVGRAWCLRRSPGGMVGRTHGPRHPLALAVDESLDDPAARPMRGSRSSVAIAASSTCWRALAPRAVATPLELGALARLPLPPLAVERITRVFERARFSNEPLALADRDLAWGSLLEIRQRLEGEERNGRAR
jgi:hypothetical protein